MCVTRFHGAVWAYPPAGAGVILVVHIYMSVALLLSVSGEQRVDIPTRLGDHLAITRRTHVPDLRVRGTRLASLACDVRTS